MRRHDFEKQFEEYRDFLRDEIHHFRDFVSIFRQIQERKSNMLEIINLAPAFFGTVERALFTSIILWAHKLIDENGERGLFNFLTFIEYNRKWLSTAELKRRKNYPDGHWVLEGRTPITVESIRMDRQKISSLHARNGFRTHRDKFHGHFDKDYAFEPERLHSDVLIFWKDLDEAGNVMGSVLNDYSSDYDGTIYSWKPLNIDDLDVLLQFATRGVQSDSPNPLKNRASGSNT